MEIIEETNGKCENCGKCPAYPTCIRRGDYTIWFCDYYCKDCFRCVECEEGEPEDLTMTTWDDGSQLVCGHYECCYGHAPYESFHDYFWGEFPEEFVNRELVRG